VRDTQNRKTRRGQQQSTGEEHKSWGEGHNKKHSLGLANTTRQHTHLHFGAQSWVVISGHVGEQVVQQLVLHATPQPFGEEIRGVGVAGG